MRMAFYPEDGRRPEGSYAHSYVHELTPFISIAIPPTLPELMSRVIMILFPWKRGVGKVSDRLIKLSVRPLFCLCTYRATRIPSHCTLFRYLARHPWFCTVKSTFDFYALDLTQVFWLSSSAKQTFHAILKCLETSHSPVECAFLLRR